LLLYLFIVGTIALSFHRGRTQQDAWTSFWIEPGFLVALLHYGFVTHAFEDTPYVSFLAGWVLPATVACVTAYWIGRGVAHWRSR
jgi:hypothetical protein